MTLLNKSLSEDKDIQKDDEEMTEDDVKDLEKEIQDKYMNTKVSNLTQVQNRKLEMGWYQKRQNQMKRIKSDENYEGVKRYFESVNGSF